MRARHLLLAAGSLAAPAAAQAGPAFTPIVDSRLRYETVDQEGLAKNADAVTARIRAVTASAFFANPSWSTVS